MNIKPEKYLIGLSLILLFCLSQAALALDAPPRTAEARSLMELMEPSHRTADRSALPRNPIAFTALASEQNLYLPAIKRMNASFPELDIVILGQDGWFYYTGDSSMRDYQGLEQYSQETLATIDDCMADLKKKMKQRGIVLLFAIAPDKQSIYPEYLPPDITKVQPRTRLDQILEYNQSHAGVPILDLRPEMLLRKQESVIYYRTDSHWNDLGAYYAYAQVMNALTPQFPALAPHQLDDYTITRSEVGGLDLAEILGMQEAVTDEELVFTPNFELRAGPAEVPVLPDNYYDIYAREIDDPSLPTAVVFRDSFGIALIPFFEEHFRRVVFQLPAWIDYDFIDAEKPDVVIIVLAERRMTAGGSPCRLPEN